MRFSINTLDTVDSTNDYLKALAREGAPEGNVVLARRQSAGRGRRGNRWQSPEGGLYLSILLRPDSAREDLATLALVVSLAVREACAPFVGRASASRILVKWPNDLLIADEPYEYEQSGSGSLEHRLPGKLAGILCEYHDGLIVGLGVNVFRPGHSEAYSKAGDALKESDAHERGDASISGGVSEGAPESLTATVFSPAYLEDLGFCVGTRVSDKLVGACEATGAESFDDSDRARAIADLAESILDSLGAMYERWLDEGFEPFADEYNRHSFLAGRKLTALLPTGESVHGVALAVGADGRLRLETEQGETRALGTADIHLVL